MFVSRVLQSVSALPKVLARLVPKTTNEALTEKPRSLYETLSRLPHDGVGARVFQTRWQSKGIEGSFWEVTRVKLKCEGKHGKAWGKLVWRGRLVSEREERIPGALKYMWSMGYSKGKNLRLVQPISPLPVSQQKVEKPDMTALPGETAGQAKQRVTREAKARTERRIFEQTIEDALKETQL